MKNVIQFFETDKVFVINMWRSAVLKASLLVVMVSLCVDLPIANTNDRDWTNPIKNVLSISMLDSIYRRAI